MQRILSKEILSGLIPTDHQKLGRAQEKLGGGGPSDCGRPICRKKKVRGEKKGKKKEGIVEGRGQNKKRMPEWSCPISETGQR